MPLSSFVLAMFLSIVVLLLSVSTFSRYQRGHTAPDTVGSPHPPLISFSPPSSLASSPLCLTPELALAVGLSRHARQVGLFQDSVSLSGAVPVQLVVIN